MYDLISMAAFRDEMTKLAQYSAQRVDPQAIELQQALDQDQSRKDLNRQALGQFLKDTAIVAGGVGAGYGLGRLTVDALKKFRGPSSSPWRTAIAATLPVVGGGAALVLRGKMREEQDRRLQEAYQRGLQARGMQ